MGSLEGHLIPGSFFALFALWWSLVTSIRFVISRKRSPVKNTVPGYRGSVTMPCICLPCYRLRRAPVESYVKLVLALIGFLIEFFAGFGIFTFVTTSSVKHEDNHSENMNMVTNSHSMHDHGHGIKRDAHAPTPKPFHYDPNNAQHFTMYTGFILGSIIEILLHKRVHLPAKLEYACGLLAFTIEAFLFAFHTHARSPLDIHIHNLLVFTIYGCIVFTLLETWRPNQVLFTYGRITFTLLQGTWFYQIGFVLYPPMSWRTSPKYVWDQNDHDQVMMITMMYCWHLIFIIIGLLLQLWVMKRIYSLNKRIASMWDELILIDDEYCQVDKISYVTKDENGMETKFISVNTEDEESNDENIQFDSTKLLKTNKNRNKFEITELINETKSKSKKPDSSSSSTSGNYSANGSYMNNVK